MSYIDALYKKDEDKIYVVERDPKKGRVFVEYDARYVFYYQDARGKQIHDWRTIAKSGLLYKQGIH